MKPRKKQRLDDGPNTVASLAVQAGGATPLTKGPFHMLSKDELQKYDDEFKGRIAHVKGYDDAWEIVLRRPESKEYKRFRSMINGDRASDAQETLVRQLAVYPKGDALDALLNDYPGIPEACGKSIRVLAGIEASEQGK